MTTDADGGYRFDGVLLGNFTLDAFDPASARRGLSSGQLTSNGEIVTLDVVEVPKGSVTGVVLRSLDQSPVAGADVTLVGTGTYREQIRTTTGINGEFTFPSVSAGGFSVTARDPATQRTGVIYGAIEEEGEEVVADVTIQLLEVGRVEGYVTTALGTPALGASVRLAKNSGPVTTVDNAGFYFFENVPLGSVNPLATAAIGPDAGTVNTTVAFHGDVARADIQLVGTGRVTGTVLSAAGAPIAFAQVTLTRKTSTPTSFSASTLSGPDGVFAFNTVLLGDLSATATQAATQLAGTASGTLAAPGDTLALTITLQPSAHLRGRVLRQDGVTPAGLMAVELVNGSKRYDSTAADGAFALRDLKLTNYTLTVTDPLGEGIVRATTALTVSGQEVDLGDLILDEAMPVVVAITPTNGAVNLPVTQTIQVLFSEAIDPATFTAGNRSVSSATGTVNGLWNLVNDHLAIFTPSAPYKDFAQITVRIKTGVKDRVGKRLAQEALASFTTADTTPPRVASLSPTLNARNVALDSTVRVTYSEVGGSG